VDLFLAILNSNTFCQLYVTQSHILLDVYILTYLFTYLFTYPKPFTWLLLTKFYAFCFVLCSAIIVFDLNSIILLMENKSSRVLVPSDLFKYQGAASTEGHSLYQCLKCATGPSQKPLSCYDKSQYCIGIGIGIAILFTGIANNPGLQCQLAPVNRTS
jgi:hypothetical protein